MIGRVGLLLGGAFAFWVILSYPAWRLGGEAHLIYSGVALVLCTLPAAATLILDRLAVGGTPETQLVAVVGGMLMRMAAVLGGGLALSAFHPYFQGQAFWLWVAVFYLFTLALEMVLIVRGRSASGNQPNEI